MIIRHGSPEKLTAILVSISARLCPNIYFIFVV